MAVGAAGFRCCTRAFCSFGWIAVPMFAPYFKLFPHDRELDKPRPVNAGIMAADRVGALFFFFPSHKGNRNNRSTRTIPSAHWPTCSSTTSRNNLRRRRMGRLPGVERSRVKAIYPRPRGTFILKATFDDHLHATLILNSLELL